MANLNVTPTTLSGDGTTPAPFWLDATAATVLIGTVRKPVSAATVSGNNINPVESWDGLNVIVAVASRNRRAQNDAFDTVAGYIFGINPPTLQPQIPRSTQFPYAP